MSSLTMLYESDFYAWALETAHLVKTKQFDLLDVEHLVEEIESMSANERKDLNTRLIELMLDLLKWQFQTERRDGSLRQSISKKRIGIERALQDNPSLEYQLELRVQNCYPYTRRYAAIETELLITQLPETCPYSIEQLFDFDFLPTIFYPRR